MTAPTLTLIDQDRFGRGEGNCFAACVATITGLDLGLLTDAIGMGSGGEWIGDEWVPTPGEEHWYDRAVRALAELGWGLTYETTEAPAGLSIVSGPANRGLLHSCVAWDGVVFHDPHPSRDGLLSIFDYFILTPLAV